MDYDARPRIGFIGFGGWFRFWRIESVALFPHEFTIEWRYVNSQEPLEAAPGKWLPKIFNSSFFFFCSFSLLCIFIYHSLLHLHLVLLLCPRDGYFAFYALFAGPLH